MPQYPLNFNAKNPSGNFVPYETDPAGNLSIGVGISSKLNVAAAAVVKTGPGRVAKIVVLGVVGTGGAFTINDSATTGAAAASNQIYTSVGTVAVGTIIALDFPFTAGLVVSAVPTGGTPLFAISYS